MADIKKMTEACDAAVKKFAADRTKENMIELMTVLESGVVFVPVNADTQMPPEMLEAAKKTGQVALPPGAKIKNQLLKATNGDYIFPVFTNMNEIKSPEMKEQVLMIPFFECAKVVMNSNDFIKGAVVNPFTDNVSIIKPLLKTCVERRDALKKAKASGEVKEIKVTANQFHVLTRNQIEMRNLPQMLFLGKKKFIDDIMEQKGAFLMDVYDKAYNSQIPCPYTESEFSVMSLKLKDDFELISADLPTRKDQDTFCYKIYITWDQSKDEFHYFVMQKQKDGRFFIEVSEDGSSTKIGTAPDEGTELNTIMEYLGMNA